MGKLPRAQVTLPAIDEREAAEALRAALGILRRLLGLFFLFFLGEGGGGGGWGGINKTYHKTYHINMLVLIKMYIDGKVNK